MVKQVERFKTPGIYKLRNRLKLQDSNMQNDPETKESAFHQINIHLATEFCNLLAVYKLKN